MVRKEQKNLKLELAKSEAISLAREIESFFEYLGLDKKTPLIEGLKMLSKLKKTSKVDQEKVTAWVERINKKLSFEEYGNWMNRLIQHNLSGTKDRLKKLIEKMEDEFPDEVKNNKKQNARLNAWVVIKFDFSNSIILYILDLNGPAIIELHSVLERQAIMKLNDLISLPPRVKSELGVPERYRLPELALILSEYEILSNEDIKFTRKLSALRDGLAHRNMKKISNAMFSGQPFDDIDLAMSDIDYLPFLIAAIHFFIKIELDETGSNNER